MEYKPIKVNFIKEEPQQREKRNNWAIFIEGLKRFLRGNKTVHEDQINEQLKRRKKFPRAEWEKVFDDVKSIEKTLKYIAGISQRVNYHYIPSDLLRYFLWDDLIDDLPDCLAVFFNKKFKIKCPTETIEEMAEKNYTLKQFFESIGWGCKKL